MGWPEIIKLAGQLTTTGVLAYFAVYFRGLAEAKDKEIARLNEDRLRLGNERIADLQSMLRQHD